MGQPLSVALPPGFFGNGTPYSAGGRYADGNLVRFVNGFARPVGGWQRRTTTGGVAIPPLFPDPTVEAARQTVTWVDNAGGGHMVVGTNANLFHISPSGVVTTITPLTDFTGGGKDSQYIAGYGIGPYNNEFYGTPRTAGGVKLDQVANWSFSLFGEILMAQFRNDGPLFKWAPGDANATKIANAPVNGQGVLVTAERIVMTIKRQPRLVEWSASEDFDTWAPLITNTAGSQVLAGEGELQAIVQVGREILIISTSDVWVGRYIGAPFIYGFEPLGQNCGCSAPNSVAVAGGRVFWFGNGGFWTYDGSVRKLETDIEDYVRTHISPSALSKICAVEQPGFREIWWFYQSADGTECDSYLALNYTADHWVWGRLDRTSGVPPGGISQTPLYIGADGIIYNHDLTGVAVPAPAVAFLETGPLELMEGGRQTAVQFFYPDLTPDVVQGSAQYAVNPDDGATVTILGKDWPSPSEPERAYGPYPLDRPIPTTGARGREIRLRYTGKTSRWRVGKNRIVAVPMGER